MILGLYIGSVYLQGASWRIEFDVSRARSSTISKKTNRRRALALRRRGVVGPMFRLEFVSQRKLHDSRFGRQSGVVRECRTIHVKERVQTQWVKALGVTHVVDAPIEFNAVRVLPRHNPAFRKRCVHAEKPGATQVVSLTSLSRERFAEGIGVACEVGECVHFTDVGRIIKSSGLDWCDLDAVAGEIPVCGPLETVTDAEREPARPPAKPCDLPAADDCIKTAANISSDCPVTTERQVSDPVSCHLVRRIEIGDATELKLVPRVLDLPAVPSDRSDALGIGSQVDGFGECIVEVKLNSVRELVL